VATYDLIATDDEQLTNAARRYFKSQPIATASMILVTTLHLNGGIPPWCDPITLTFSAYRRLLRCSTSEPRHERRERTDAARSRGWRCVCRWTSKPVACGGITRTNRASAKVGGVTESVRDNGAITFTRRSALKARQGLIPPMLPIRARAFHSRQYLRPSWPQRAP
jgi:hypothetical protein